MPVKAEPLEQQLVDWLRDFQPDAELRTLVLEAIQSAAGNQDDDQDRRRDLHGQLDRLKDLYVMGDLTRSQYVMRRQALEEEVQRIDAPIDPDIAKAETLLDDFARFWEIEDNPAERQKLLAQLFDRVWQDGGVIVAVKPRQPFARYFQAADAAGCDERERRDSNPRPLA